MYIIPSLIMERLMMMHQLSMPVSQGRWKKSCLFVCFCFCLIWTIGCKDTEKNKKITGSAFWQEICIEGAFQPYQLAWGISETEMLEKLRLKEEDMIVRGDIEFRYGRKEISSTELFGIPVQDWYYFAGEDAEEVGLSGLFACEYTFQFNLKEECYKFAGEILESARKEGLDLHYSCSAKNLEEYTGQDLGWLGIDGSEFTMHREFREEWKCMILQIRISVPLKEIWRRTHLPGSS